MKWISVKDRVPAQAGYYLVWTRDEFAGDCVRFTCYFNSSDAWEITHVEDVRVTHWMELPKGPDEVD